MFNRDEAMDEIRDVVDKIEALGDELRDLVQQHLPDEYERLDAYGAFDLTHSRNPYDITIQSVIDPM